jgi:hypothetical protein
METGAFYLIPSVPADPADMRAARFGLTPANNSDIIDNNSIYESAMPPVMNNKLTDREIYVP